MARSFFFLYLDGETPFKYKRKKVWPCETKTRVADYFVKFKVHQLQFCINSSNLNAIIKAVVHEKIFADFFACLYIKAFETLSKVVFVVTMFITKYGLLQLVSYVRMLACDILSRPFTAIQVVNQLTPAQANPDK